MLISYRQGLVSAPANYLTPGTVPNYIGILVGPGPILATIADGDADYLIGVHGNVANAWGPFTGSTTQYLFVELDDISGVISYGATDLPVSQGAVAPSSPDIGQMWWDSINHKHFVWDGFHWMHKLRVFLGTLDMGSALVQQTPVSQVGLDNVPAHAGFVLTDGYGSAFRDGDGDLLTTETPLLSTNTQSLVKIDGAQVVVQANEPIPAFTCVYLVDGRAQIASSDPPFEIATSPIAMVVNDVAQNDPIELIMAGKMVFNQNWSFTPTQWGMPLYCDADGLVSFSVPSTPNYVRIGYAVSDQGVYLTFDTVTNPIVLSGAVELFAAPPLSIDDSGPVPIISIARATSSVDGYMAATDFARIPAIEAALPTFALLTATWPISSVTGLTVALSGKADTIHTHSIANVTGLQTALDNKLDLSSTIPISQVTGLTATLSTINTTLTTKVDKVGGATNGNIAVFSGSGNIADSMLSAASFAAVAHTHPESDVTNLVTDLANKAALVHTHVISDVSGLQTALNTILTKTDKVAGAVVGDFASLNVSGNLVDSGYSASSFAALIHPHTIAEVTGLQTALDGKLPIAQAIPISQVTNLQTTLNGKSDVGHTHTIANVTGLQSLLDSKLNLSGGVLTGSLTAPSVTTSAAVTVGTNLSVGSAVVVNQNGSISLSSSTGTSGQVLTSNGASAASWATILGLIPTGGTAGQVLSKIDSTNYNVAWTTESGGASAAADQIVFGTGTGISSSANLKFTSNTLLVSNIRGNVDGSSNPILFTLSGALGSASAAGGGVTIVAGDNSNGLDGGELILSSGGATGVAGTGGDIQITTGVGATNDSSGDIILRTAAGAGATASSGNIIIETGQGGVFASGTIELLTNGFTRLLIDGSGAWELNSDAGTAGYVLTSNGSSGAPTWTAIPAGNPGTVTSIAVSGGTTGMAFTGGPITSSGTITLSGFLIPANGGTGLTSYTTGDIIYASGSSTLAKLAATTAGKVLTANGVGAAPTWQDLPTGNPGTVTSINVSGGTTGLTATGGPVTSSGTITLAGTLAIANGGTGATSANAAFQALAPVPSSIGTLLVYDSTNDWVSFSPTFPADNGKVLSANGATLNGVEWISLPTPTLGTVTSVNVSGGTTGLTATGGPVTSSGTITLAGTLVATNGGTGIASYVIGDILYASTTTALSVLSIGATGRVLTSNGTGVAPSWQVIPSPPAVSAGANEVMYGTGTSYTSSSAITVDASSGSLFISTLATSNIYANSLAGEPVPFSIIGASGTVTNPGGSITITSGGSFNNSDGGLLTLQSGTAGGLSGNGGDVVIASGAGGYDITTNTGGSTGNVTVTSGVPTTAAARSVVAFTSPVSTGTASTGLANNATAYTASLTVDGGSSQPISVVGSAAQTFNNLITELNADSTGGEWALLGGDLVFTADSVGVTSSSTLVNTTLFSTLTNFSSITNVAGYENTRGVVKVQSGGSDRLTVAATVITATKPVVFPSYTLATLPTGAAALVGGQIFVSNANSGVGTMAFWNGTNWIDIRTGVTVA